MQHSWVGLADGRADGRDGVLTVALQGSSLPKYSVHNEVPREDSPPAKRQIGLARLGLRYLLL